MQAQRHIEAIEKGCVIDHIPANTGLTLLNLFQLGRTQTSMMIGLNLPSTRMGQKDLIKINGWQLDLLQRQILGLFAPEATLNVIENFQVQEKTHGVCPVMIETVFQCPNKNCITRIEPVKTRFLVNTNPTGTTLKCAYCEKTFGQSVMKNNLLY